MLATIATDIVAAAMSAARNGLWKYYY